MRTELSEKDITQELVSAVETYLHARAQAQAIRHQVDQVQRQLLNENPLPHRYGGAPITDTAKTYLATDEAIEQFFSEIDARLRTAGIKPQDMDRDFCPALVAEDKQRRAELAVITEAGKMLEIEDAENLNNNLLCQRGGLRKRQEFLDTTIQLVVSAKLG